VEAKREPGNDPGHQDPPSPPQPPQKVGKVNRVVEQALRPLYEVNQLCIELLVKAAWSERVDLPLVCQLRAGLRSMSAEAQARAAQKAFLLVDMEFTNTASWKLLHNHSSRAISPSRPGYFPRSSAIQLTRAALLLLRHSIHSNAVEACLLGVHPTVAEMIGALSMSEIERLAERRDRYVRPRWEDRPAVWHELIQAACSPDIRRTRECCLHGLQLLAGDLLQIP
jgi:hypothetical protein